MVTSPANAGVLDTLRKVVDGTTAGRVFGEPVIQNGVIMLPVARVSGVAGGGSGTGPADDSGQPEGAGGGFGTSAKGLGVFVLKDGKVSWRPAVDVNRVILGGQLVAITALVVLRAIMGSRGRPAFRGAEREAAAHRLTERFRRLSARYR